MWDSTALQHQPEPGEGSSVEDTLPFFQYQKKISSPGFGVEDAIIHLLQRTHSRLDKAGSTVRVMFFDFSSVFNTIQSGLLQKKLQETQVDALTITWITDYLTNRPQFVTLNGCVSEQVVTSTGPSQGTVLSPFLFTLYTSDFQY